MDILAFIFVYLVVGLFLCLACVRFRLVKRENVGVPLLLWPILLVGGITLLAVLICVALVVGICGTICNVISRSSIGDYLWHLGGGELPDDPLLEDHG